MGWRSGDDEDGHGANSYLDAELTMEISYKRDRTDIDREKRANLSAMSPNSSRKKSTKKAAGQLPHHKAGRVKVGIRCRPPFQEEIERVKGTFYPIIETKQDPRDVNSLGRVALTLSTGKQREFMFDYVFGPSSSQDHVYDRVARPVVNDVLNGFNGTIFAYGQTGTGKTYTMGILETVTDDTAGLIPRTISGIFQYAYESRDIDIIVTMSFLQIYRENIQDLLSAAVVTGSGGVLDDNLPIREDPQKGFYVEGLQEYVVHSYEEAEALLNLGLESRAIASTLMNSTSSRSHTVLTINIEQKGDIPVSERDTDPHYSTSGAALLRRRPTGGRILHSKLLMVDLAGSERVRKTISKGTRLDEAKSINTSLSALGNVIAALAESNTAHVPYRDSKLTRILHDSLGGTASTSLIATVGPAASNYNETLSTLQFASRCMAVKSTPVQHEELDFAVMCTRLQQQLSNLEGDMSRRLNDQEVKYESIIRELREQLKAHKSRTDSNHPTHDTAIPKRGSHALESLLDFLETGEDDDDAGVGSWLNAEPYEDEPSVAEQATVLLAFCFDSLRHIHTATVQALQEASDRAVEQKRELATRYHQENARQLAKKKESHSMEQQDPMRNSADFNDIGSHLAPMSRVDALYRIEENFSTVGDGDGDDDIMKRAVLLRPGMKATVTEYTSPQDLAMDLDYMSTGIVTNMALLSESLQRKDKVFRGLKDELLDQQIEKRSREEEVVNWSYILKYLLATTSKLRDQLKQQKQRPREDRPHKYGSASPSDVVIDTTSAVKNVDSVAVNRAMAIATPQPADKPRPSSSAIADVSQLTGRYRMRSAVSTQRDEDLRRQSQAGKLGPRLAQSFRAVQHNTLAAADIDQIGPPDDDDFSQVGSEADGSFRSAATVGSIPPYSSRHPQHSSFAQDVVNGLGVQGHQAIAAMSVIDRVSNMTEEQIRRMDSETQAQVRQIRKEIGLDRDSPEHFSDTNQQQTFKRAPFSASRSSNSFSHQRSQHPQGDEILPSSRRFPSVVSADLSAFASAPSPVYRLNSAHDEDDDDDNFSQLDSEVDWN